MEDSIIDLSKYSLEQLKEYTRKLYSDFTDLQKQNYFLSQMVDDLKKQIKTLSKPTNIAISNEEMICELEIQRLLDKAIKSPLSLEETKKLDLLVKNLNASKEKSKKDRSEEKIIPTVSVNELIQIASESSDDENI